MNASDEEKARYQTQLRNSAAYKTEQTKYGTGSDVQRGIQAAVGALQGLAGGNIGAALAGASAPELANIIGHKAGLSEDDIAAKAIAHAILGGVVAAMQGNNAAAGAAGAAAGELAANAILKTMYPGKHVSELDESDRQLVSNLATIASGLAGNLAGAIRTARQPAHSLVKTQLRIMRWVRTASEKAWLICGYPSSHLQPV
ncbi:Uncharacterised protein [Citrobacter freundii]|nr:Uncharacterised protein [Citrobacter freundii]